MSGMLWEVQKRDTEMQSEQMLMEKWHQQTHSMQGPHKPSICKKKKKKKNETKKEQTHRIKSRNTVSVKYKRRVCLST